VVDNDLEMCGMCSAISPDGISCCGGPSIGTEQISCKQLHNLAGQHVAPVDVAVAFTGARNPDTAEEPDAESQAAEVRSEHCFTRVPSFSCTLMLQVDQLMQQVTDLTEQKATLQQQLDEASALNLQQQELLRYAARPVQLVVQCELRASSMSLRSYCTLSEQALSARWCCP
jgi:hypothetical protein